MKLCIISNLYPPYARGGAERIAARMAEGLKQSGHDVFAISTKPKGGISVEEENKVKIYRFRPMNLFYYLNDYKHNAFVRLFWHGIDMLNFHGASIVKKILKDENPDLVITHNLKGIGLLIPKVIRKLGIRHIHVIHDVQLAVPSGLIIKGEENSFAVAGFLTRLYARICCWLFGSPETIISPSQWLINFCEQRGFFRDSKKVVLRNPLPPLENNSLQANQSSKRRNNSYLFIGQLRPHKGIDWLVNLWREQKIKDPLTIIGNGEIMPLPENVVYRGDKVNDALAPFLNQADFLIVPSLCYENSPSVIMFAYKNGTPVIVSDIGGAGELVEEGKTGFKFEAGSVDSFANALNKARGLSGEQYALMRAECFRRADEFLLDRYLARLSSIISG